MYKLKCATTGEVMDIKRKQDDALELTIGGKSITVLTEDLAALVRHELPEDRAKEMFSEIEERAIKNGKARVSVVARTDIKKGDPVNFTIDINKYVDSAGNTTGLRMAPVSGFIY